MQGTGPLAGVRVVDFSRILAGPLVTQTLAELGAAVIKIERPETGDDTRSWGPPYWGDMATYFTSVNKGKRSISLDLQDEEDRTIAEHLVATADVLVENFRPGVIDRLGFGYEVVAAMNPRLVYCTITGFGSSGEAAQLPGVDLLLQAMAGWMNVTGQEDGPPTKVGMAVVDVVAGLYATVGVAAALAQRAESGVGRRVEVSLFESALAGLVNLASGYLLAGDDHHRAGNRHPSIAPYEPVIAADRQFVLAAVNDSLFATTCEVIGRPDLIGDHRFRSNPDRRRNVEALMEQLNATLAARPAAEWIGLLRAEGVPVGEINSVGEAFELAAALGIDPVSEHPDGFRGVRSPILISGSAGVDLAPPPELDSDGAAVRRAVADGADPWST